jgi:hypothetical protein
LVGWLVGWLIQGAEGGRDASAASPFVRLCLYLSLTFFTSQVARLQCPEPSTCTFRKRIVHY